MFPSQLLIVEHALILVTLVNAFLSDKGFKLSPSGHEVYPRRFDVDMDTQMLGSVKPYHRQVGSSLLRAIICSYHFGKSQDNYLYWQVRLGQGY